MSSLPNQPVEKDIISAFETTQNQSWSVFNDKLGGIPTKDSKKIDTFKSENPIELLDEDIPVFGTVPRLDNLTLVSCKKCSMVVKRDCIHYHYNNRHNSSDNVKFSLEKFISPIVKTNRLKRSKPNARSKIPAKKIAIDESAGHVVQNIKTEFDEQEFERTAEINRLKIKQENVVQCDDKYSSNLEIENCPSTSCGIYDWSRRPRVENLIYSTDNRISIIKQTSDELQTTKNEDVINEYNTVNYIMCYNELYPLPDLNDKHQNEVKDNSNNELYQHYQPSSRLENNKEKFKSTSQKIYLNILDDVNSGVAPYCSYVSNDKETEHSPNIKNSQIATNKEENNNISDNIHYQLPSSEILCNKEQTPLNTNFLILNVANDNEKNKISSNSTSHNQLPNIKEYKTISNIIHSDEINVDKHELKFNFLNLIDKPSICDCKSDTKLPRFKENCLKSKIKFNELLNPIETMFNHIDITDDDFSSVLSLKIKGETKHTQNNKHSIVINKNLNDTTMYDNSTKLKKIKKELRSLVRITDCQSELIEDDYCCDNSGIHLYPISKHPGIIKYEDDNSDSTNKSDDSNHDKKYLPIEKLNATLNQEYSNVMNDENSEVNNYSQIFLDNKIDSESIQATDYSDSLVICDYKFNDFKNEYCQIPLQNSEMQTTFKSNTKFSNINNKYSTSYNELSVASSVQQENTESIPINSYSDFVSDKNVNNFISHNDQFNIKSQKITTKTKYTQTDVCLKHMMNHKQFIDPIARIDETITESLGFTNDKTKCIQTDLFLECMDCCKTTNDLIGNYIPSKLNIEIKDNVINNCISDSSSSQITDSVKSFTPVVSGAQIINNTIIPISHEKDKLLEIDECDVPNSSHDLSCFQEFPRSPESHNDYVCNRLKQNYIIKNNQVESNDKLSSFTSYVDKPKYSEYILHRNKINGTIYVDKNHSICKDRLKKAIDEKIVYGKNCKIPYNGHAEFRVKKSLKKRLGEQVADDKENHNRWITGGFKKLKRIEFVMRKVTCSDESDNNENVDE